jgi:hypothetical protein
VSAQQPINNIQDPNMKSTHRVFRAWPLAITAVAFACSAQAQMATSATTTNNMNAQPYSSNATGPRQMYSSDSFSVIPYSTNGYIGLNIGQPDWSIPCTGGGFGCSESNTAYNIYTGGMFNQYFGAELGYVDFGKFERGGGRTRAAGVNLSLVGHLPLGAFNVYGKIGTLYGRTDTTSSPVSGLGTGKRSGWEGSYGVGVGYQLSQRSMVVLEWNRYDLDFADVGRRDISTTSLGYVYRF